MLFFDGIENDLQVLKNMFLHNLLKQKKVWPI